MQNTSAHSGANAQWASPVAGMYQHPSQDQQSTHQRQASNPRAYPGQDDRRDAYGSDQGMQAQQQSQYNYPQNYAYNAYANVNNLNYPNARRTSGTKATTPPPTAPVANQSPQYYNHRSDAYPTSAPPHMSAHSNQPQTAHPSYYPNFHDNASQSHQPWQQQQSYQATSTQGRTQATGTSSQTFGQGTGADGNRAFDYTNQSFYPDRQSGFRPQYYPMHQQVPPGYPSWQQPTSSFYYGQQQQSMPTTAQPGLPGMPSSSAQANVPTPTTPIIGGKKSKGKKDDAAAGVLGKRSADAASEDEGPKDGSKKKKGKKDEEKPPPKPQPAKSHLHPPRQAQSAWQLFFTDELNKAKAAAVTGHSPGGTPQHAKLNVAQIAKDAGAAYGSLNDEQKAYYAEKVLEDKERFAKELVAWQATLTPEDIRQENAFRAQQRKEGKSRKGNLKDPNAPKKPLSAYFLFLKSIREDDDLRAKVWGEETETTKQSVLAAERWRGLSDEEKKPYLTQAEHDKQEYETARKLYEDDAAARARGEDVPERPIVPESSVHIEAPKSLLKDDKKPSDFLTDAAKPFEVSSGVAAGGATDFADMEEYHGFHDPLEGMDLTGLEGMAATDNHEGGWDELQKLMGTGDDKTQSTAPALGADAKPAPAPDAQTRQGALAAEGALSVPTGGEPSSGVPTEDVSDQAGAADAVVKAE